MSILLSWALLSAFFTISCAKEAEIVLSTPGTPCPVELNLVTEPTAGIIPVGEISTRTADDVVRDINYFVYDEGGEPIRNGYSESDQSLSVILPQGTYRIYVVANVGGILDAMSEGELRDMTMPVTAYNGFLKKGAMYMAGKQTLTVDGPTTCRLVLRRLAARVDLTVRIDDAFSDAYLVHVLPANAPSDCPAFADHRLTPSAPQLEFPYADLTPGALRALTMSYYQYENLAGSVGSITDPADRIDDIAPPTASYVTIRVLWDDAYWDYKVYLGSNSTTDFNVRRNTIYNYNITIEGVDADDLRISTTEYIFWVGRKLSIGGQYYRDGFAWNARVAYSQLEIVTDNCDPEEEYSVSFRPLSGTFKSDWTMEYMISSPPSAQREYRSIVPEEQVAVHKGNGTSEVVFAFSNYEGTQNYNTEDNYFEFTVQNSRGWGRTVVLSTNMDEWFK